MDQSALQFRLGLHVPIQLPDEYVEENQGVCIQTHNNSFLFHFLNMGKIYNIYELYKKMYKDEFNCDDFGTNLSSSQSSSSFI